MALAIAILAIADVAGQNPLVPGVNVNMVRGTSFVDGDPYLQRQNEPAIAISTRNPCHLLAGANDYRTVDFPDPTPLPNEGSATQSPTAPTPRDAWVSYFTSMDCGATWKSSLLPGHPFDTSAAGLASVNHGFTAAADPVVRAGTNGLFFYSGLVFDRADQSRSQIFVARFIDNNNKERGDTIAYVDAAAVDVGDPDLFVDKPTVAVDYPRAGAGLCRINGQQFPAGRVYVAWARFEGGGARIMISRSLDCGQTWQAQALSDTALVNQGASIAIAPHDGTVYVAWRQFGRDGQPSAIQMAVSRDAGATFTRRTVAAAINPFDQAKLENRRFRTNTLPTIAADHLGRVYVAWAERGFATASGRTHPLTGDARIVMAVSSNFGQSFGARFPIDDTALGADGQPRLGHQVMPALTFTAGKLQAVYYDFSDDISETFNQFVDEAETPPVDPSNPNVRRRHTVDVRAAHADPAVQPRFIPVLVTPNGTSPRLSQYRTIVDPDGTVRQVQFNPPNLPLFVAGTTPFIGDYIDVAGLNFVPFQGGWRHNNGATASPRFDGAFPAIPVYHSVWADHRDVKPPVDGDWTNYKAPGDPFWMTPGSVCVPSQAGMRNANIYTSRIDAGLYAGSPGNTKPLGFQRDPKTGAVVVDPTTGRQVHMQRSFVVFVQNSLRIPKTYVFRLVNQPGTAPGDRASFLRAPQPPYSDADLATRPHVWLVAQVAPLSTISRTVFVTSANERAMVRVDVVEVAPPAATAPTIGTDPRLAPLALSGGLRATVLLNPDPTNPTILDPDHVSTEVPVLAEETHDPEIFDPVVTAIGNVKQPFVEIRNPDEANPDEANPDEANVDEETPDEANPDEANPDEANPDEANPDEANPDEANAGLTNTALDSADLANAHVVDVQWKVRNRGNTTTAFRFSPAFSGERDNRHFQLLITKRYYVPAVDAKTCEIGVRRTNQVIVNVSGFDPRNPDEANPDEANPDEANPDEANPDEANPDEANPDEANATFFLAPGETATATLRIYDTSTAVAPPPAVLATFEETASAVIQSFASNTGEAAPPRDAAGADLVAVNAVASPANVAAGGTAQLTWVLANRGTEAIAGTFRTRFLFSTDRAISDDDQELAVAVFTGTVPADDPATAGVNEGELPQATAVTLPPGVVAGPRFILVLTDALNEIPEADEGNNAAAATLASGHALAFIGQPATTTQGFTFAAPVRVAIVDTAGSPTPAAEVPLVRLAVASGPSGAVLGGTLVAANVGGVATFADITVPVPGGYTLLAVGEGVVPPAVAAAAVSAPFIVEADDPPVANPDSYAVAAGVVLNVGAPAGVVSNDADELLNGPGVAPPGRVLTAGVVQPTQNGNVVLAANGAFAYTPAPGFNGVDFFTYRLNDGVSTGNVATVRIAVGTGVGNAPPVAQPLSISVNEDGAQQTIDVVAGAIDADGDAITLLGASALQGSAVVSNGNILYTPNANYFGPDTIDYTIGDGQGNSTPGVVSVTVIPVNDNPVARDDGPFVVGLNAPATAFDVLDNDDDGPDAGETLAVSRVGGAQHGTVSFTPAEVRYTPNRGYTGPDSFSYEISDGNGGRASAIVSVTVGQANQPPSAQDDAVGTDEDTPASFNVLANDSDPDGDALAITAVTQPQHGAVVIDTPTTVRYTPAGHFNGADSFTYTVSDPGGLTATATVNVSVTAVNDAPVVTAPLADVSVPVNAPNALVDLTAHFDDVDIATNADVLTFSVVGNSNPAAVSASVAGSTLTLDFLGAGTAVVTVQAEDGFDASVSDSFIVSVGEANATPIANPDAASTPPGTPVTINVLANDTDPDRTVAGARVLASIPLNPPGVRGTNELISVLAAGPGTRYVYAGGSSGVSVIDTASNAVVELINAPSSVANANRQAVDAENGIVYFSTTGNTVFAIDGRQASATLNDVLFATAIGGSRINGLVVDGVRDRLYVLSETFTQMGTSSTAGQSRVVVIDADPSAGSYGNQIAAVTLGTTAATAVVNPANGTLFLGTTGANSGVYVMDDETFQVRAVTGVLPVLEMVIDPAAGRLYGVASGGNVLAVDLATETLVANSVFAVPGLATQNAVQVRRHVVLDPNTGRIWVRSFGTVGSQAFLFALQPGGSPSFWSVVAQLEVGRDSNNEDLVIDPAINRVITTGGFDFGLGFVDTTTNEFAALVEMPQALGDLELFSLAGDRRLYVDGAYAVFPISFAPFVNQDPVYVGAQTGEIAVIPALNKALIPVTDSRSRIWQLTGNGGFGGEVSGLPHNAGRYLFVEASAVDGSVYAVNTDTNVDGDEAPQPGFLTRISALGQAFQTFNVGNGPTGLAVNQTSGRVHVPATGSGTQIGGVTVVDPSSGNVSQVNLLGMFTTNVGRHIAIAEGLGKAYFQPAVVDFGGSNLGVYPEIGVTATRLPASLGVTSINAMVMNNGTNLLYVGNQGTTNQVVVIDATNDTLVTKLNLGSPSALGISSYLAIDETRARLYVLDFQNDLLHIVDATRAGSHAVLRTLSVGDGPSTIAINRQTNRIYVGSINDRRLTFIDGNSMTVRSALDLPLSPGLIDVDTLNNRIYASVGRTTHDSGPGVMVIADDDTFFTHPLSVTEVTGVVGGTALVNPDQTITFTPAPAAAGGSFQYRVTDGQAISNAAAVTIQITSPLTITTASLPAGTAGAPYAATLDSAFGTGDIIWSVSSGLLPSGLALTSGGTLHGVPSASGTFTFAIGAQDESAPPQFALRTFTVSIGPLTIPAAGLPLAVIGEPYSASLLASGPTGSVVWSLASGALPPGLSLDASGVISGIPTAIGFYAFSARVVDEAAQTAVGTFSVSVDGPPVLLDPPLMGEVHGNYNTNPFRAIRLPVTVTLLEGTLPSGFTITATGAISGTVQTTGRFPLRLRVTDGRNRTVEGNVTLDLAALDQAIGSGGTNPGTQVFGPTRRLAQTFTAGVTGQLAGIRASQMFCSPGDLFSVEVRRVTGADVAVPDESAPPLATGTLRFGFNTAGTVHLAPFVRMSAGERYAVIYTTAGACEMRNVTQSVTFYHHGHAFESVGGGPWQRVANAADLPVAALVLPDELGFLTDNGYSFHRATMLPDGDILLAGGNTTASFFTPATGAVRRTTNNMAERRFDFTATLLDDGRVLIAGGQTFDAGVTTAIPRAEVLDNGVFGPVGQMAGPRARHAAVKLPDGRVLIAGGWDGIDGLSSMEIFDPSTNTFAPAGSMLATRYDPSGILLQCPAANPACSYGGKVMLGGDGHPELYDPLTGMSVQAPGSLAVWRSFRHTATQLADGRVLFVGGNSDSRGAEILDLETGASTVVPGSAALAIERHSATRLPDGRVLIAGGRSFDQFETDFRLTVLQFDPATQSLSGLGSLNTFRADPSATLLPDGRMFLAGGFGHNGSAAPQRSYEVFDPAPAGQLGFTTVVLPPAQRNVAYPPTPIQVSGGTAPYTLTLASGQLPPGLTLVNGVISGTPTSGSTYAFAIRVTDSSPVPLTVTMPFVIRVDAIAITTTSLPGGSIGVPYFAQLQATGTAPFTWSVVINAPPAGLTLSSTGAITGTPAGGANTSFRVRVEDAAGQVTFAWFFIDINDPPFINATAPPAVLHEGYGLTPFTGGTGPYTLTHIGGAMPRGLSISNGFISGTPLEAGLFAPVLRVVDSQGRTSNGVVVLIVGVRDQSIGIAAGGSTQAATATRRLAQTFTAGADGVLAAIQLSTMTCTGGNATVSIWPVSGAGNAVPDESGVPLAVAQHDTGPGVYPIDTLPFFRANERFAVVVETLGTCALANVSSREAGYPFGHGYESVGGGPWTRIDGAPDLPIQTRIVPIGLQYLTSFYPSDARVSHLAGSEYLITGNPLADILDTATGVSRRTTNTMNFRRFLHTATTLDDGRVLVVGGVQFEDNGSRTYPAQAELFAANQFALTNAMNEGRESHSATKLPDGRVVIIGGRRISGATTALTSIQIFNPTTNTFASGGALPATRYDHSATLLTCPAANPGCAWGGRILVFGGTRGDNTLALVYDPVTQTSTPTSGSAVEGRGFGHSATLLLDGRVLIVGGSGTGQAVAEIYNPATGTFAAVAGPASLARFAHTATRLPDGDVLIAGGQLWDQFELGARTDLLRYDVQTSTFSGAGSLLVKRAFYSSTLLDDGRVLLVGGFGQTEVASRSVEYYHPNAPAVIITTTSLPNGVRLSDYPTTNIAVTGGTPPYTFEVISGSLPPGLVFNNGSIAGAVGAAAGGTYSFTVAVEDSSPAPLSGTQILEIRVTGNLQITPTVLPQGAVGAAYSAQLQATGGFTPYRWSHESGLPGGLTIGVDGQITGIPTTAGSFNVRVRVEDAAGQYVWRFFTININASAQIASSPIPLLLMGAGFDHDLTATGTAPFTWEVLSGALPAGMATSSFFNQFSIGGFLLDTGRFTLVVRVTDAVGSQDTETIVLDVFAREQVIGTQAGGVNQAFGAARRIAQTLTVGATGDLRAVRLPSLTCSAAPFSATVDVRRVVGSTAGVPDESSQPLASAVVAGSASFVLLNQAVPLSVGERIALVVSTTGACQLGATPTSNTYVMGQGLESAGGGPWVPIAGSQELPLETAIEPVDLGYVFPSWSSVAAASLPNGEVLVVGNGVIGTIVSPATGQARDADNNLSVFRSSPTMTPLLDGSVLIAGGSLSTLAADRFAGGVFTPTGSLAIGRISHTATLLPDGRVVVAGGENPGLIGGRTATVEIYDPASGTFSAGGALLNARDEHMAVLLSCPQGNPGCAWGGRVLFAGGDVSLAAPRAEIYNPATLSSAATAGAMLVSRARGTATLLADGRVLFIGGSHSLPSAEIFDPATGAFAAVSNSPLLLRFNHSATLLNDGSVLVMGGLVGASFEDAPDILRVDPATGGVTGFGMLRVQRRFHATIGVPDGRLLVAGGFTNQSPLPSRSFEFLDLSLAARVVITTVDLPVGQVNVAYPPTLLSAAGGAGPHTIALVSGTLPPGLTLVNGILSGTPAPGSAGQYQFVVEASDSSAGPLRGRAVLTILVTP